MQLISKVTNSVLTKIFLSFVILAITISAMYSTLVMAETGTKNNDHQLAQSTVEYDTKADISREKMTIKTNNALTDTRIGAFSMKDGAMEGYYGDGEYAE